MRWEGCDALVGNSRASQSSAIGKHPRPVCNPSKSALKGKLTKIPLKEQGGFLLACLSSLVRRVIKRIVTLIFRLRVEKRIISFVLLLALLPNRYWADHVRVLSEKRAWGKYERTQSLSRTMCAHKPKKKTKYNGRPGLARSMSLLPKKKTFLTCHSKWQRTFIARRLLLGAAENEVT